MQDGATRYTLNRMGSGAQKAYDSYRYRKDPIKAQKVDEERQKQKAYDKYMSDSENRKKAAIIANNMGKNRAEDVREIQKKMFELDYKGMSNMKDQQRAIEMTEKNGKTLEQNAFGVDLANKVDLSDEKKRDAKIKDYMLEAEGLGYKDKQKQLQYAWEKTDVGIEAKNKYYRGSTQQIEDHQKDYAKYIDKGNITNMRRTPNSNTSRRGSSNPTNNGAYKKGGKPDNSSNNSGTNQ